MNIYVSNKFYVTFLYTNIKKNKKMGPGARGGGARPPGTIWGGARYPIPSNSNLEYYFWKKRFKKI
jgi:predicted porin